jgi:hypothetical protein
MLCAVRRDQRQNHALLGYRFSQSEDEQREKGESGLRERGERESEQREREQSECEQRESEQRERETERGRDCPWISLGYCLGALCHRERRCSMS